MPPRSSSTAPNNFRHPEDQRGTESIDSVFLIDRSHSLLNGARMYVKSFMTTAVTDRPELCIKISFARAMNESRIGFYFSIVKHSSQL
jgi:hypothetical protein